MTLLSQGLIVFSASGDPQYALHLLPAESGSTLCAIPAHAGTVIGNPASEHDTIWSRSHRRSQCASCAWHLRALTPAPAVPTYPGSASWVVGTTRVRVTTPEGALEGTFYGFARLGEAQTWHLGILEPGDAGPGYCPVEHVLAAEAA